MIHIGEKVMINMPLQAGCITRSADRRKYNSRVAKVISVEDGGCRLDIDYGKFLWPSNILARPVSKGSGGAV